MTSLVRAGSIGGALRRLLPEEAGRDFRWLFGSHVAANIGDGILLSAGPLLVTTLTRDPFAVSLAVFVQWLPGVIVGIPAGAIVDRTDRRRLTIVVNLVRAAVLATLAGTIATGVVSLPILYLSLFLLASAESERSTTSPTRRTPRTSSIGPMRQSRQHERRAESERGCCPDRRHHTLGAAVDRYWSAPCPPSWWPVACRI